MERASPSPLKERHWHVEFGGQEGQQGYGGLSPGNKASLSLCPGVKNQGKSKAQSLR